MLEFQKAFSFLNAVFFNDQLKVLQFELNFIKKDCFLFHSQKQIIFVGNQIVDLDQKGILAELLHELIHVYNFQNEIVDLTKNQYHNGKFTKIAVKFGFFLIKDKNHGYSKTCLDKPSICSHDVLTPSLPDNLNLIKHLEQFEFDVDELTKIRNQFITNTEKPKSLLLKYVCGCPKPFNSIRSGRRPDSKNALDVKCLKCGKIFFCDFEEKYRQG